jgi:hypothetical protein
VEANALPQCHLRCLQKLLGSLSLDLPCRCVQVLQPALAKRRHCFWLDTFCTLVLRSESISTGGNMSSRTGFDSVKKMAIDVSANANTETLMAYVNYCGWTTRGWTLQEGSLPIVFALSGRSFAPDSATTMPPNEQSLTNPRTKPCQRITQNDTKPCSPNLNRLLSTDGSEHRLSMWQKFQMTGYFKRV